MNTDAIPSIRFSNPVTRFLGIIGFDSPKKAFIVVLVSNIVTQLAAAFYFDAWGPFILPNGVESEGLSGEPGAWVVFLIAQPVLIGMMVWVSNAGDELVKQLIDQKALTISPEAIDILQELKGKLMSKRLNLSAWIFGFIVQGLMILIELGIVGNSNPTWINVHPSIMIYRTLIAIPVYFSVPITVYSIWTILKSLSEIMRLQGVVSIEPFHSDGAGGLAPLGKFVANVGYLLFALGFVIAGLFFQSWLFGEVSNYGYLIGAGLALIVYLVCAPLLSLVPLFTTHTLMLMYKQNRIDEICAELNQIFSLATKDIGDTKDDFVVRIRYLTELKGLAEKIPTWPINTASLRKYYSLTLSPFITLFLGVVTSVIIDLIVARVG
jgi:hypothetical protein